MPRAKRKPAKPRKDEVLRVRILAAHKRVIEDAAERDGLEVSAWVRRVLLRAAGVLPDAK